MLGGSALMSRTLFVSSEQIEVPSPPTLPRLEEAAMAERLASALRFPTISAQVEDPRIEHAFRAFDRHLELTYPRVHAQLSTERFGEHAKLYRWEGTDDELAPVLLLGHVDVVPVEEDADGRWTHPPFAGVVDGEHVWGRGALDDKVAVVGALEAAEHLLAEGYRPRRTVYFAFGDDEEMGGHEGAGRIARALTDRGVHFAFVLDEGGVLVESSTVPGIEAPVAFIGVAEKGYATLELKVGLEHGGHSSMPPSRTAIGILSDGLTRLDESPMSATLRAPTLDMLASLAPEMSLPRRVVMSNLWLFEPLVMTFMETRPSSNASVRTTHATTVIEGGAKDNVLPTEARALVNFRIAPGDTKNDVLAHVADTLDDERIEVQLLDGWRDPTAVSDPESDGFRRVETTIRQIFPSTVVTPYLTISGTDARHFEGIADDVYRFLPVRFEYEDRLRVHGHDERIAIADYANAVRFYMALVKNL